MSLPIYSRLCAAVSCLLLFAVPRTTDAQAPTTASIAGRIVDERGGGAAGVDILVTNRATGIATRAMSSADGRFLVSGLAVGGPYAVTARRVGSAITTDSGFFLSLGQRLLLELTLGPRAKLLDAVETRAPARTAAVRSQTGVETLLSDSILRRMPVINRDLYDLVRLVPQMSTWFGSTAVGANPRANSVRVDGIADQISTSNVAAGALYGGKAIPLDAVKEYQVLFSPFDVRYGGFSGASVNAVTRSGTNDFHGSLFAYGTNEQLGANVPLVRDTRFEKKQFGLSLGGPLVRDRLLFFLASEFQKRDIPAVGPYIGGMQAGQDRLPVRAADVTRFQSLLIDRGLDGGSAGAVTNPNPSSSLFLRLDAPIPSWNTRLAMRANYGDADSAIFARPTVLAPTNCPSVACFPLSTLQHSRWITKRSAAVQMMTNFESGAYNEALVGYTGTVSGFRPVVRQPLMLVTVPSTGGGSAILQSGTHEIATGQRNANSTAEFTDNFSVPVGSHRLTIGGYGQLFSLRAFQLRGSYGIWEFASLDSFAAGLASRYRVTRDTGSLLAISGGHAALYIGDEWTASARLSLTFGMRADVPFLHARPPYVAAVDSVFHVRSDAVPSGRVQWSPRVGFSYDVSSEGLGSGEVRGGIGTFVGRMPLYWMFGGFASYGLAARTLQCGLLASDAGRPPAFRPDFANPPQACAGGQRFGASTSGEIDVIDSRLRLPTTVTASLTIDHDLPLGFSGSIETLVMRSTRATLFSALNLREPVATDRDGRLLYGAINSSGVAMPSRVAARFGDVISVTDRGRSTAYDVTAEVQKSGKIADASASVSYGRTRDVQSGRPVSALLVDDWRFGRPVAGRNDARDLTTSDYDQPLRVRVTSTLHSPWRAYRTDLSFFYVGGTGFPYTYVAGGTQGRGDLNADGAIGNDPIYVPRSALDSADIAFAGTPAEVTAQRTAFERFMDSAPCLRRQRGRIMARNSCRAPWMNLTNVAVRQRIPAARAHSMTVEMQVFNLLNLLNPHWGSLRLPGGMTPMTTNQLPLLTQVGETTERPAQPMYRFDTLTRRYSSDNFDSYYQIQLAVRYGF